MNVYQRLWQLVADAEPAFDERKHPRAKDGEFAPKGKGATGPADKEAPEADGDDAPAPRTAHLKPAPENREHWPKHIQELKLPPAWHSVYVSHDPHADLLAVGRDAKGRSQYVYSQKFVSSQSAIKFARIASLDKDFDAIMTKNASAQRSRDPKTRDHADCFHLVATMGLRPGSDDDTGAEKKAYGASTLEGQHVVHQNGQTRLQFVGKKGVSIDLPVEDPKVARMLRERAKLAGHGEKLFPSVSDKSLLDYTHAFGSYKTKDLRTRLATRLAHEKIQGSTPPKNNKEYQRQVREVAKHVSSRLGNTPAVALASYISPVVWGPWRSALGGVDTGEIEETAAAKPTKPSLPGVRFGKIPASKVDWRSVKLPPDPDNDELRRPSRDHIRLLGFDPTKSFVKKETAATELPETVVSAFRQLGQDQRGRPERAMLNVQFANGGGVLNPVVEHVGDITHRMSHMAEYNDPGYLYVKEKVNRVLRYFTNPYGFEREHAENLRANSDVTGKNLSDCEQNVNAALKAYAREHAKLRVYNQAQYLAREAAVAVGERKYADAVRYLKLLQRMVRDPETWHVHAFAYKLGSDGDPVPYQRLKINADTFRKSAAAYSAGHPGRGDRTWNEAHKIRSSADNLEDRYQMRHAASEGFSQ